MDHILFSLENQLGKECHMAILKDGILQSGCASLAASKGIGMVVILLSIIMKIPQIGLLLKSRSAEGLNLSSVLIETIALNIISCYCYANGQGFTTYGDCVFVFLQDLIILALIFTFRRQFASIVQLTLGILALNYYLVYIASLTILDTLMLLLLPMMLFGTIPQLLQNYNAQSSGNLSAASIYLGYFSCLARVYTNYIEVDALMPQIGGLMGAIINTILVYQVTAYPSASESGPSPTKKDAAKAKKGSKQKKLN